MNPEGRISIEVHGAADRVTVRIASSRPLTISRQFRGRAPRDVMRLAPLLFAVCKAAHGAAASAAFEDAMGIEPSVETRRPRAALVLAETAREHALRVAMDWPKFLGREQDAPPAAAIRTLMEIDRTLSRALDGAGETDFARLGETLAQLESLVETHIIGEELTVWLARRSREDLASWAGSGRTQAQRLMGRLFDEGQWDAGAVELSPLPRLDRALLADRLFAEDTGSFIAAPDWEGRPCETTPLTRNLGRPQAQVLANERSYGIGARLVACLVELARCVGDLRELASGPLPAPARPPRMGGGIGLAEVEAARGRLIHAVRMEGDKVGAYRILAPTEWNFHPRGAVAGGLAEIARRGGADRDRLAKLFIMAVDPCVGADVTFP
jgi:uptake hydrogenase large subunit